MYIQTIVICILILLIVLWLFNNMRNNRLEKENQYLASYTKLMKEHYETLQMQADATRKYRHDIAKHIQTLEYLMKDDERIEECLDVWKKQYQDLRKYHFCEDAVIDALLSSKRQMCEEKGILCEMEVQTILRTEIAMIDLTGILHNLFDNAIEACERIRDKGEKRIVFCMYEEEKILHIYIKNTIQKGTKITFATSKKDKELHGIGMEIIKSTIEKYKGNMECLNEEEMFSIHIRIGE